LAMRSLDDVSRETRSGSGQAEELWLEGLRLDDGLAEAGVGR